MAFPASPAPHRIDSRRFAGRIARVPEKVRQELARRGHRLNVLAPYANGFNAAIVSYADRGVLMAGADPRYSVFDVAW